MAIFAGRLAIRWQGCPITPLGMRDGVTYWLDYRGEFRALTARQLGAKPELLALIGSNTPWLWEHFPKRTTRRVDGELRVMTVTYSAPALVEWLVKIAAECDMFGPQLVIRKPGVWPGEDGEPVAHLGDKLWIDHKLHPAGLRTGNMLWPAHPPVGKPGEACGPEIGKRLQLEMQELWRFRQAGGAHMCLGVVASGRLGPCARWRPSLFLGGDVGGGKSYLLDLLCACCVLRYYTTEATKAGLTDNLAGRAMPSFVDEASDQVHWRRQRPHGRGDRRRHHGVSCAARHATAASCARRAGRTAGARRRRGSSRAIG
jgi:hypothetical protein